LREFKVNNEYTNGYNQLKIIQTLFFELLKLIYELIANIVVNTIIFIQFFDIGENNYES